ncbi:MAG: cell division protein ZapB [bacterium]
MDLEQLDVLEGKINHAVRLIEKLKLENQKLMKSNHELRSDSESKEQLIQQLQEENQNLKHIHDESSVGKEKEEKIKSKVEQMLARLDELQINI